MPLYTEAVANYFLELATRAGAPLDPMKIQKLVYLGHGWHLAFTAAPLIDDQVQAWAYGPVIPALYHEFKRWGNGAIRAPATRSDLGESPALRTVIPSIFEVAGPAGDVRFAQELMERTWAVYGQMTGLELTQLTHAAGSPWHKIRKRYPDLRSVGIPNWMIRKHFRAKLQANASGEVLRQAALGRHSCLG